MAYVAGDILVQVRGSLAGVEMWNNSWAFVPNGASPDAQAVVDALNAFYTDLAGSWMPAEFTATGATIRDLFLNVTTEGDWTFVGGANTGELLPSQLAIRVSLNNSAGVNGGPFLAGWATQVASTNGLVASNVATDIETAVENLDTAVQAADYLIGLHRPTVPSVEQVTRARVGTRFDVIRKRSNDTAEAYITIPVGI